MKISSSINLMSRSHLRNRYMREISEINTLSSNNRHRLDEMPKNNPSKFITKRIKKDNVCWLQESTSFGGHSIPKGGHRKVSGILRAKLKEELREQTKSAIDETRLLF